LEDTPKGKSFGIRNGGGELVWGNSIDKNLKNFLIKQQLYRKIQNFVTLKWETKP